MNDRNKLPRVAMILPIRNEALYVAGAMQAILEQDYAGEMEVLVADGMSTDGTRETVERIASDCPRMDIRIVDNSGLIVATGMNLAVRSARGEIIIRVDGHCIIAPDYVSRCVEHLLNDRVDGVGGSMQSVGDGRVAKAIALAMSSRFGVGNSAFRTMTGKNLLVDTVPFPAYTRQIIERVRLYDEELVRNQDDEYNYRIREAGGKILLADDVRSTYFARSSLRRLWLQYFEYGYWKVRVLQKHPRQMQPRQFVPPLFVAALLGSLALGVVVDPTRFAFVAIAGAYLLANLCASIFVAARKGWAHLPLLPLAFAILHVSYGLGFLEGLVRFWNRWGDRKGRVPDWSLGEPISSS